MTQMKKEITLMRRGKGTTDDTDGKEKEPRIGHGCGCDDTDEIREKKRLQIRKNYSDFFRL